jgi:protein-L-isoaspartate(D-aspartate) O-methyltransferase
MQSRAVVLLCAALLEGASIQALGAQSTDRPSADQTDSWARMRQQMVLAQIQARGVSDRRVLEAMERVPRHLFVPQDLRRSAYEDTPLPIGYGQTISQPYIVGFMTELLNLKPGDVVLEVGTGSGYQAAVLAEMGVRTCSIEIVPELGARARATLDETGYASVRLKIQDGYWGWETEGPFDGIIVTAAADHVPPPLVAQLKPGGRMVIPIGAPWEIQNLMLLTKDSTGAVQRRKTLDVRFVPFTRAGGP